MTINLRDRLETYMAIFYPDRSDLAVSQLANISDGWEGEMYSFILSHGPETSRTGEKLVLRIYPGDNAIEKSLREAAAVRRLYENHYPVPMIFANESDLDHIGRPFVIMEWIEGRMMWPMLDRASDEEQRKLIELFCGLFVQLHRLDWRRFSDLANIMERKGRYRFVDSWFAQARDALSQYKVIDLQPIVSWLDARRDNLACQVPSPVHQDFHPGNILLGSENQATVIDWTGFDVTDFRFDLAWTLVLAYAYSGREFRDAILVEYERQMGSQVDEIETFEVFACSRRLFDVFVSLSEGAQRLGMRPEAVKAIRQHMNAVERVYELLVHRTGISLEDVEELIEKERKSDLE